MKEKTLNDLEALRKLAEHQDDKINLSTILINFNNNSDELKDILLYFDENGIEIINEDVEPDYDSTANNGNTVVPFDPSQIDIKMDKITIDSIIKRIKNDELEFDSSFQRKSGLWKKKQKSQLIESIFLKIPLPAFYFDASDDDKWQIIDGLQRIGTIKEFVVDNSFALTDMEFLQDLNGSKFTDLPRSLQRRIEETNLNAYLVNPSTPKNVKFNIFKRINTGGLVLEPQEIRNALYQGQAAEFLLRMSQNKEFIRATDHSVKSDRMLDREFCLRYVAFTSLDIEKEYTILDDYLNKGMDYLNTVDGKELNRIYTGFERVMRISWRIFEKYAFRRLNISTRRGPVNKALFETWSFVIYYLSRERIEILIQKRDELRDHFADLCADYGFQNLIRASDKNSVKYRIEKIQKLVEAL